MNCTSHSVLANDRLGTIGSTRNTQNFGNYEDDLMYIESEVIRDIFN